LCLEHAQTSHASVLMLQHPTRSRAQLVHNSLGLCFELTGSCAAGAVYSWKALCRQGYPRAGLMQVSGSRMLIGLIFRYGESISHMMQLQRKRSACKHSSAA
jgi:hypothetical protein